MTIFLLFSFIFLPFLINCQNVTNYSHPSNTTLYEKRFPSTSLDLSPETVLSIFCIMLGSTLTTICGLGGGPVYLAVFLLILQVDVWYAVPLSALTIAGSALVRFILFALQRHPLDKNRGLIDYSPLQVVVPFSGNTAFLGYLLSITVPKVLNLISIIIVIIVVFVKTVLKAVKTVKEENRSRRERNNRLEETDDPSVCVEMSSPVENPELAAQEEGASSMIAHQPTRRETLLQTVRSLVLLFISFALITIATYTRRLFKECSNGYWIHYSIQFPFIFIWGMFVCYFVKADFLKRQQRENSLVKGDIVWSNKQLVIYAVAGSLVGVLSTYLGIGGGLLLTPLMMNMGMLPEVVIATSGVATFFASFIGSSQYIIANRVLWDFGALSVVAAGLGSLIGVKLNNWLLKRFNRSSIIIIVLAVMLLVSLILLIINGIKKMEEGVSFKFNPIC